MSDAITCPCCGAPMNVDLSSVKAMDHVKATPSHRIIIRALVKAFPRGVPRDALISHMYSGTLNGGPDSAVQILRSQVCALRKHLSAYGWTIASNGGGIGNIGEYRLERLP